MLFPQLPGILGLTYGPSSTPSTTDVHTVASLLKLYLRELPEPVIPFARYEDFLSCAQLLTKDEGEVSASGGPILGLDWLGGRHMESGHKCLDFSVAHGSCSQASCSWAGRDLEHPTLWGEEGGAWSILWSPHVCA